MKQLKGFPPLHHLLLLLSLLLAAAPGVVGWIWRSFTLKAPQNNKKWQKSFPLQSNKKKKKPLRCVVSAAGEIRCYPPSVSGFCFVLLPPVCLSCVESGSEHVTEGWALMGNRVGFHYYIMGTNFRCYIVNHGCMWQFRATGWHIFSLHWKTITGNKNNKQNTSLLDLSRFFLCAEKDRGKTPWWTETQTLFYSTPAGNTDI